MRSFHDFLVESRGPTTTLVSLRLPLLLKGLILIPSVSFQGQSPGCGRLRVYHEWLSGGEE